MELTGKVSLVTGASKGIGGAIAIALAQDGCSVAINYKADKKAAEMVLRECDKYSKGNILAEADVSVETAVAEMLDEVKGRYGHLDILINNAGIFDQTDSPTNINVFQNIYRNNLLSCVLVIKYALPIMQAGKIVNISSIYGRLGHGRPDAIAYSAFKAALESYTKNLAKTLAPNILVNAIAPGRVATPMWGDPDEKKQKELGSVHLIKRMIQPDEIASGAIFLCKNDAVCGEVLTIDGGFGLEALG